jgi:hypothetical protein
LVGSITFSVPTNYRESYVEQDHKPTLNLLNQKFRALTLDMLLYTEKRNQGIDKLELLKNEIISYVNKDDHVFLKANEIQFASFKEFINGIQALIVKNSDIKIAQITNQIRDAISQKFTFRLITKPIFYTDKSSKINDILFFVKENKLLDFFEFVSYQSDFFSIDKDKKLSLNSVKLVQNLILFTDIIGENYVLNKNQQVLKIIKPEGNLGDYCEKSYERPHYLLCNKTFINRIRIQIKDNNHNTIHFNTPGIIAKIHIKKIKKK